MKLALKAENLSKQYRLGQVGTGTLSHDINRLWHQIRGKEDPYLKIGETNDRTSKGDSEYVWSLRDINFEIEQGDAVGIVGRNGAGKSTLLKLLSKVTKPTTGRILTNGRIASLLEVGTGFHPEMTGRENVFLNGAILGMTRKEINRKFDEIVDFSGVERYIDTPVKRYSSGMYVRLAFAVAAHLESEILIVDEVLAVGDAEFQKKCLGKMGDVTKGEGRTVLFVSHNMDAVKKLCDKGIFLDKGSVKYSGNINKTISMYNQYLFENKTIDYTNDDNKKEKVSRVFISDENGIKKNSISSFDGDYFLNITLQAENFSNVEFGCTIFTEDGEALISSEILSDLSAVDGVCNAKIRLPHNLLTEGNYYLEGAMWRKGVGSIEQKDYYISIIVEPRNLIELEGGKVLGKLLNPNSWIKI